MSIQDFERYHHLKHWRDDMITKSILCHLFVALTLLVGSAYIIYRLVDDMLTRIPLPLLYG